MTVRPASLVAVLFLLAVTRAAEAREGGEPVWIAYSAPAGCPDETAFAARLRERAGQIRIITRDEPARTFVVKIEPRGRGVSATFAVIAPDGTQTEERTYESATCTEVVNIVALAAALTIDEDEAAAAPATAPKPSPAVPRRSEPSLVVPPLVPAPRRWDFALALLGAAEGGVAPAVVGALRLSGEIRAPWEGRFAIRAGLTRSASASAEVEDAAASFTWTSGLLDVCPYAAGDGMVSLSLCARIEAGVLEGRGERIEPAISEARFWLAVGGLGRMRVAPWRTVFFELEGGVRAPILRDRFSVRSELLMFRPPALGWNMGAGVGVLFP